MKRNNLSPRKHALVKAVLLLAFVTGLTVAPASAAVLVNGGFESGLTGWTESGGSGLFTTNTSLNGFYGDVNPAEGAHFGLISNNGVASGSIFQEFDITDNFLLFSYRFTTDELNTGADYNDVAHAILTVGGTPTTLFTVSRDDLQAGGEGSLLPGAAYLDNTESGFDIGQDGWRTVAVDVSAYLGQSVTLSFEVNNVNDSTPDIGVSQLAVDNIHTSAVPEPSTGILFTGALGLLGLLRLHRKTNRS